MQNGVCYNTNTLFRNKGINMDIKELKEKLIKDIEYYKKEFQDAEFGRFGVLRYYFATYKYYEGLIAGLQQALKYIEE